MRISDWSSDVCSSDLLGFRKSPDLGSLGAGGPRRRRRDRHAAGIHHRLSARLVIHRHARWTAALARRRLVGDRRADRGPPRYPLQDDRWWYRGLDRSGGKLEQLWRRDSPGEIGGGVVRETVGRYVW